MARRRVAKGIIDFDTVSDDDTAILARYGDSEARNVLWSRSIDMCHKIAGSFVAKYPWITHDDLSQEVLSNFPRLLRRYRPAQGTGWNKFLYHTFYRACQDALRLEDPLGLGIPQKMHYPFVRRFSEICDDHSSLMSEINDGIMRLRNGEPANLSPDAPPPSTYRRRGDFARAGRDPKQADTSYHGPRMTNNDG